VWDNGDLDPLIQAAPKTSFLDFILWVENSGGKQAADEVLTLAWACWAFRNKVVVGKENPNREIFIESLRRLARDYHLYASNVFVLPSLPEPRSFEHWVPPPSGWVKLNCDAAILDGVGTGIGWVARDDQGHIIEAAVWRCNAMKPPDIAEAEAARWALQQAVNRRWRQVVIESDSLGLISKLQIGKRGRSYLDIILDDISSLLPCFDSLLSSHVKRAGNVVAHCMARFDPGVRRFKIFRLDIPICIITLAEMDVVAHA